MISAVFELLLCLNSISCQIRKLEPFIVGGAFSKIENFPHSVYLESFCGRKSTASCGASILNQQILLTAAHCVPSYECLKAKSMHVKIGSENRAIAIKIKASHFIAHENYTELSVIYDIALVLLEKPIKLNNSIGRVAIRREPVISGQVAKIAGWGYSDPIKKYRTVLLKHVSQIIITRHTCQKILGRLPEGVFCARDESGESYPSGGDSGSALIVDDYIQVGLVSYKLSISKSIIVYTDVAYYYNWIQEKSYQLYCCGSLNYNVVNIS